MPRRPGIATQARQLIAGLLMLVQKLAQMTAAELKDNVAATRGPLASLAVAMTLMLLALVLLVVAIVLALAQFVGPLAATIIVALASALAGWALARNGLSRLSGTRLAPTRSIATLQAQIDRFAGHAPHPAERPQANANGGKDD